MHFDHPNRIFNSIKETWDILARLYDNRELIPEVFSMAEIFLNTNCNLMGKNSSNLKLVDDLILPSYANRNPINFTYIHRFYLEDRFISDNLIAWIDNIFGENQLKKNKESLNVFKKCCYAQETNLIQKYETYKKNNININSKTHTSNNNVHTDNSNYPEDDSEEKILKKIDKILNFGQNPAKLFEAKHLKKNFSSIKSNDYETVFNDLAKIPVNMKKPIRYLNKSKNFVYVLYFDNEVEVLKINNLEKNHKFQMKIPANLLGYNYNYLYIKKKLNDESEKLKIDKENNLIEITKRKSDLEILKSIISKINNKDSNNKVYNNHKKEYDIKSRELKYFERKKEKFVDMQYLSNNYYLFYYYNYYLNFDKSFYNKEKINSNKISHLITEDILMHMKLDEKVIGKSQFNENEKIYNDKILLNLYKERFYITEFSDCKFFVACQYLDNSIKVYKEETKVIEFLMEEVKLF